jgi:arsenate reductase
MLKIFKSKEKEIVQTILFVCVENAGRSQMAEGFFKKYAPSNLMAISAGTKSASKINPIVVEAMKEVGIDISNQKSKDITEDMIRNSTKIVNMGCMEKESCPTLFLHNVIDWNLEDPKSKSLEDVRRIRDEIEQRVQELVAGLKSSP